MNLQGVSLDNRGLIWVSGPEAEAFLQGLITNDVSLADRSNAIYAALLTPQGKFLHDFIVVRWKDGLLLDTDLTRVEELGKRLAMYRLRAKIEIADLSQDIAVVALLGPGPMPGSDDSARVFADPRHPGLGQRAYIAEDARAWLQRNDIALLDADQYDLLRVKLGVPDGGRDVPVEKAFPLEYGFDALNAVSYEKGCYIGQELTARTHNRGKIKKGLFRIALEDGVPEPGTEIRAGDAAIGTVLSGSGSIALAHLRLDVIGKEGELTAGNHRIVEARPAPVASD